MITGNPNYFNLYATKGHDHDKKYFTKHICTVLDFNDALYEGGYKVANNSTGVLNAPYNGHIYGKLIVYVSTADRHNDWDNWIWQIFYDTSGGIYFRYKVNNAPWHSWRTLYSTYSLISDRKIDEIEVLTNRIETLEQTINQLLNKVNSDL